MGWITYVLIKIKPQMNFSYFGTFRFQRFFPRYTISNVKQINIVFFARYIDEVQDAIPNASFYVNMRYGIFIFLPPGYKRISRFARLILTILYFCVITSFV